MHGNNAAMNHALLCSLGIWKVNMPVRVLNLWSNSQTGYATFCLISFIFVIHCDSRLMFLKLYNQHILDLILGA
jgi:hypothetical protein